MEVLVIFVRLFAKLFVEACAGILFLFPESRFEGSSQGVV